MANLGFQLVYRLINSLDFALCERAFVPSAEDISEFSQSSTPLFSYETQTPLKDFDIVAFSVSFEEDYRNIPGILGLSSIPIYSRERDEGHPLILAGGIALSINPEPVSDFVDLFIIGEGEGAIEDLLGRYREIKEGRGGRRGGRVEALRALDEAPSVYVPSLYEFAYDGEKVREIRRLEGAKAKVTASRHRDLGGFPLPQSFITTPLAEFKGASLVEIERGCGRACRFCAAGFLYLPPRMRPAQDVKKAVREGMALTGKAGLVGSAVSEHPAIKEVIRAGIENGGELTLSSLRLDCLDSEFLGLLKEGGYRTVTLAPEAGSERMRNVVNKGIGDEEILDTARLITEAGFSKIKLYFMVGLPKETDEDALSIAELSLNIKGSMGKGELALSINPFIPKPFTPFQWERFEEGKILEKRLSIVKGRLRGSGEKGIRVDSMPVNAAFCQAYISRADRRGGALVREASVKGWRRAARSMEGFMEASALRQRDRDETLPWDLVDHGIGKDYLWKEYQRGLMGKLTPPCDVGRCFRCGVC